jgi:hypothetical protein
MKIENVTEPHVKLVLDEMRQFQADFRRVVDEGEENDLGTFWLRKTKKPVLAVLLVQKPGKPPVLYRGKLLCMLAVKPLRLLAGAPPNVELVSYF